MELSSAWTAFRGGVATLSAARLLPWVEDRAPGFSEWLGSALSEGFYIIGWVSLWNPVETLLFDPLPVKRENKVLKLFLDMPIGIEPRR